MHMSILPYVELKHCDNVVCMGNVAVWNVKAAVTNFIADSTTHDGSIFQ